MPRFALCSKTSTAKSTSDDQAPDEQGARWIASGLAKLKTSTVFDPRLTLNRAVRVVRVRVLAKDGRKLLEREGAGATPG